MRFLRSPAKVCDFSSASFADSQAVPSQTQATASAAAAAVLKSNASSKLFSFFRFRLAILDKLPTEASFDAEMAVSHVLVERRSDPDNVVLLHMQSQGAADTTVGTDGVRLFLLLFVPRSCQAHFVFAAEHQRTRGANADAVAAINTGGVGQRDFILRGNVGVETPPRYGDGECILRIFTASLNALVAENAFPIIAHIKFVVDLDGLIDRGS